MAWETPGAGTIATGPDVVYIGLKHADGYPGYIGMAAVDKTSGKTLWKSDAGFFSAFLEYQHTLNRPDNECRVFALHHRQPRGLARSAERVRNTGVRVFKADKAAVVDLVRAGQAGRQESGRRGQEGRRGGSGG